MRCAVNHLLWLHVLTPTALPLCLVFHVLIPPAPFSAVAKKGVTIELYSVYYQCTVLIKTRILFRTSFMC